MKKIIAFAILSLLMYSCNSKHGNMLVKGRISNFQKGKVYLEKMIDTLLVKVDSVTLEGNNEFVLSDNIDEPQVYYVSISDSNKYLQFFGEKGEINISSNLKNFGYKPMIKGSKNQELLDEFNVINKQFINEKLNLIKKRFDVQTIKDSVTRDNRLKEIERKINSNIRRKYLYTINFAAKHADFEMAPYLIMTEISNANPKLLDTIEKIMTYKVKKSLYGKKFVSFMVQSKK